MKATHARLLLDWVVDAKGLGANQKLSACGAAMWGGKLCHFLLLGRLFYFLLRQKSCQEISCSRSGGIKEVSFV
jgi:hypothetical protein